MPNYASPGVYVLELPNTGARDITPVGSSLAGFVGLAPDPDARPREAVAINDFTQFASIYFGAKPVSTPLANAVAGFFINGGSRCYVVNIGTGGSITGTAQQPNGLDLFDAIDEISIVAAPGFTDADSYAALQAHCENMLHRDRMAILDTVENVEDVSALTRVASSGVPAPADEADAGDTGDAGEDDGKPTARRSAAAVPSTQLALAPPESSYLAVYTPWIVIRDAVTNTLVTQPPSGHMAGVWARVDTLRGVHKAPANEPIFGALDLTRRIGKGEQDLLNPAGINCIRFFPGEGILVWGARTRATDEFRMIPVRRLSLVIRESIEEQTRWVVFEPNDYQLWKSIGRDIRNFLYKVWKDGALFGRTADEAYFVKCDAETNPPELRDAGQVRTIVGFAAVKPAEFSIVELMQSAAVTDIPNEGE